MIPAEKNGFTLIELILIIIVLALMGAIIAPLFGPALTGSHRPPENLDHAADLSAEMAKVIAEYRNNPPATVGAMNNFRDSIPGLIDNTIVNVAINERIMFEQNGNIYEEGDCIPGGSLDCVLKVRLQSTTNPGEALTYYFPYQR